MTEDWPATLIVMALEIESQGLFERARVPVLYTGLGKVNAALSLMRALRDYRHAGSAAAAGAELRHRRQSPSCAPARWSACHRFVQRDMDVSAHRLSARAVTPFEEVPAQLEFPPLFSRAAAGVVRQRRLPSRPASPGCTAKSSTWKPTRWPRSACWSGARFGCAKFVTDGADRAAAGDWQRNLPSAAGGVLGTCTERHRRL